MANDISLSIDISVTDQGVLNDDTSYISPQRVDVAVFVTGYKTNSASVQAPITLTPNNDDPELVTFWTFDIAIDGWYQFYYTAIPDYDPIVTYAQYDAVYDPLSGDVYRSLVAGNIGNSIADSLYWEVIADPASLAANEGLANESANIDAATYQRILTPKVDRLYGDKAVQTARECCSDCEMAEHINEFEVVFVLREGALISEERLEYADGERMIRRLDEFIHCS